MRSIRPARLDESPALSALCRRSKAYWGYDAAFMRRADASLTVTREAIASGGVLVSECAGGRFLGVVSVTPMPEPGVFDLLHLFIEPDAVNLGVGRELLAEAVAFMRRRGGKTLLILSDPHAAGFYRRMGAMDKGEAPSDSIPERLLPLLELAL